MKRQNKKSSPKDIYTRSPIFIKRRKYCEMFYDKWYILSAKHYLLKPNGPHIAPYNKTLLGASEEEKEKWSYEVFRILKEKALLSNTFIIHGGKDYYEFLIKIFDENKIKYKIPTKNLGLGEQLSWYNNLIKKELN